MKKIYKKWEMNVTALECLDILTVSNLNDFFEDELPPIWFN